MIGSTHVDPLRAEGLVEFVEVRAQRAGVPDDAHGLQLRDALHVALVRARQHERASERESRLANDALLLLVIPPLPHTLVLVLPFLRRRTALAPRYRSRRIASRLPTAPTSGGVGSAYGSAIVLFLVLFLVSVLLVVGAADGHALLAVATLGPVLPLAPRAAVEDEAAARAGGVHGDAADRALRGAAVGAVVALEGRRGAERPLLLALPLLARGLGEDDARRGLGRLVAAGGVVGSGGISARSSTGGGIGGGGGGAGDAGASGAGLATIAASAFASKAKFSHSFVSFVSLLLLLLLLLLVDRRYTTPELPSSEFSPRVIGHRRPTSKCSEFCLLLLLTDYLIAEPVIIDVVVVVVVSVHDDRHPTPSEFSRLLVGGTPAIGVKVLKVPLVAK